MSLKCWVFIGTVENMNSYGVNTLAAGVKGLWLMPAKRTEATSPNGPICAGLAYGGLVPTCAIYCPG